MHCSKNTFEKTKQIALKTRLGKFFWKMLGQLGRSTDQIWLA